MPGGVDASGWKSRGGHVSQCSIAGDANAYIDASIIILPCRCVSCSRQEVSLIRRPAVIVL